MLDHHAPIAEAEIWINRFKRNAKEIFINTLLAGTAIFIFSYGGLFVAIRLYPSFFIDYINPVPCLYSGIDLENILQAIFSKPVLSLVWFTLLWHWSLFYGSPIRPWKWNSKWYLHGLFMVFSRVLLPVWF